MMLKHSTTEITSNTLASDNPLHQRLLAAYYEGTKLIGGNLLEVGCGVGRGTELLMNKATHYTAVDKNEGLIQQLKQQYSAGKFIAASIPPFQDFADETFDSVISFQVIEHIPNDALFVQEIYRVLKKGGVAVISTPNIKLSLTRNPWHIREYTAQQLHVLCSAYFSQVEAMGIAGNQKVLDYHEKNRESVRRITRFDVFNLQYRLPAALLRLPYDVLNRLNRNKLDKANSSLVSDIQYTDYYLSEKADEALDLFFILKK
jgi:2-polyprenyl-3-methyl-5-hydroxy-6-metoxy-1,4-benzoquinol methylase